MIRNIGMIRLKVGRRSVADYCNQCNEELFGPNRPSDYPDYGPLEPGEGWCVICEGCGYIRIDREGNCIETEHEIPGVKHDKQL
jgi:hypothetical protein